MEILPAHHYQFSGLLTAVASLYLVILVYKNAIDKYLRQRFVLYYLSLFIWSLSLFICTSIYNYQLSYLFCQLTHVGAIMIPVFFLHFTYAYLNRMSSKERLILRILYCTAIFFLIAAIFFRGYFFGGIVAKLSFPYFPNDGPLYTPWVATFAIAVMIAHFTLFRAMLSATGIRKKQIRFFLIANLLGYLGGIGCFLPVYDLPYFPFPYGPYGVFLLSLVSGYAILKHRFIDLKSLLKKSIEFAFLFAFIIGTFSFMVFVFQNILSVYMNVNPFLISSLSAVIIIFAYDKVRNFLIEITDRFLFQKKEKIEVILNSLAERLKTIFDLDQIGKAILSTLAETFRLESGFIFVHDDKMESYRLADYFGLQADEFQKCVTLFFERPEVGHYFKNDKSILTLDNLDLNRLPNLIKDWLELTKARAYIPLVIDENQRGLLVLGKKKSDQEFSHVETIFFPTIQSQVELAIRSVLFFGEAMEEREAKIKAEDTAKRVHYAEILGHEMKNKLSAAVLTTKNLTERTVPKLKNIHEKYLVGNIADNLSEAMKVLYNQAYKAGQEIKEHLHTMKIITKTAQSHLSNDEEAFEEIYVKMVWEDTVKGLNTKDINIQFLGPSERNFFVFGNAVRLEQVFRNLIQNSIDAMESRDSKSITLDCSFRDIDGKRVGYIVYTDNGPGVPPEIHKTMFDKGVSTKPKPRGGDFMDSGSGYGLYLCKDLIEGLHKGKFWYDKTYAGGARFIFWIPTESIK